MFLAELRICDEKTPLISAALSRSGGSQDQGDCGNTGEEEDWHGCPGSRHWDGF
jgi:hypothetical protein